MISIVNLAATILVLVMLPAATARIARLITRDSITSPIREWIYRRFGETSFLARLVECHWCSGVWASIATNLWGWTLVGYSKVFPIWMCIGLGTLAIPATAYLASRMIDREDA